MLIKRKNIINEFVRKPLTELTEDEKKELFSTIDSTQASLMALL